MANPPQASCYVLNPQYTFLFSPHADSHDLITCTICNDSKLTLPNSSNSSPGPQDSDPSDIDDTVPVLLPCSHVFGQSCLTTWLRTAHASRRTLSCPVCRFPLRYATCRHPIPPLPLAQNNILFIPLTVPAGGTVGKECAACTAETDLRVTTELCMPLAKRYYELSAVYEESGWTEDRERMEDVRARWEDVKQMVERSRRGGGAVGVGGLKRAW